MTDWRVIVGDCRDVLRSLPAGSVHTCVTSPPYFGLRDYGTGEWEGGDPACDHTGPPRQSQASTLVGNGHGPDRLSPSLQAQAVPVRECRCGARRIDRQIGLEPTPDEFVAALVGVFEEVRRVLRDDGTVWLNLGDSYFGTGKGPSNGTGTDTGLHSSITAGGNFPTRGLYTGVPGVKSKDLLGIPWMVAFALRADGWYLRSDIIWSKPNPMPESVTDRPTKAHEYVFLLSKGPRYFYDADAIREPHETADRNGDRRSYKPGSASSMNSGEHQAMTGSFAGLPLNEAGRNKRSVWTIATQPYAGAHFATFPPKLIEPCILAGAPERACGECGAPWVRVVEREGESVAQRQARSTRDYSTMPRPDGGSLQHNSAALTPAGGKPSRTLGFEPSCSHYDDRYRAENPQARRPRKRMQRVASGDWWRRTRSRRTNPTWSTMPGVVLDPFAGSGTTGVVSLRHGREFVGIELSPAYAQMARDRIETAVRLGFRAPKRGPEMNGHDTLFDMEAT